VFGARTGSRSESAGRRRRVRRSSSSGRSSSSRSTIGSRSTGGGGGVPPGGKRSGVQATSFGAAGARLGFGLPPSSQGKSAAVGGLIPLSTHGIARGFVGAGAGGGGGATGRTGWAGATSRITCTKSDTLPLRETTAGGSVRVRGGVSAGGPFSVGA